MLKAGQNSFILEVNLFKIALVVSTWPGKSVKIPATDWWSERGGEGELSEEKKKRKNYCEYNVEIITWKCWDACGLVVSTLSSWYRSCGFKSHWMLCKNFLQTLYNIILIVKLSLYHFFGETSTFWQKDFVQNCMIQTFF